ncbi:MAG TPA: hypothetical protein VMF58_05315 [Rhizomicrobium sp.]|nr:hypothetical protein [Rhizomicrobium sp.]
MTETQTPEQVAYLLLKHIAKAEGVELEETRKASRKWILDTYAECIITVRTPASRFSQ